MTANEEKTILAEQNRSHLVLRRLLSCYFFVTGCLYRQALVFSLCFLPLLSLAAQSERSLQLLERQKQLYLSKEWDSFFGGAIYLRADSPEAKVLDHGFALELMALARHCQWGLIRDLENSAPQLFLEPLAKKTMAFIRLKQDFQQFSKDTPLDRESALGSLKASRNRWKVTAQELRKLTSPQELKMHVRSLCVLH